jgi:hypothetical protein
MDLLTNFRSSGAGDELVAIMTRWHRTLTYIACLLPRAGAFGCEQLLRHLP